MSAATMVKLRRARTEIRGLRNAYEVLEREKDQTRALLQEAGFALRNWMPAADKVQTNQEVLYTNDRELLTRIDTVLKEGE